jgi:thioredoxin-related protein
MFLQEQQTIRFFDISDRNENHTKRTNVLTMIISSETCSYSTVLK